MQKPARERGRSLDAATQVRTGSGNNRVLAFSGYAIDVRKGLAFPSLA